MLIHNYYGRCKRSHYSLRTIVNEVRNEYLNWSAQHQTRDAHEKTKTKRNTNTLKYQKNASVMKMISN